MSSTKPSGAGRSVDRALVAIEALIGIAVVAALVGQSYGAAPTVVFLVCALGLAFTGYSMFRMIQALRDPTLDVRGRIDDEERVSLEHEKMLLLQGIKELEADAAVGKVDADDYQHLRSTAEQRAMVIIQRLKESDRRWMVEAESLVEKRLGIRLAKQAAGAAPAAEGDTASWALENKLLRAARRALRALFDERPTQVSQSNGVPSCTACQRALEAEARYCSGCGRPIESAAKSSQVSA